MQGDVGIFVATHSEKCKKQSEWIIPIQVGAALRKEHFEDVLDSTGDHISNKNKSFCELTALYWMWKNTNYEYIGLYHYRRKLNIDKQQIISILNQKDIILPRKKQFRITLEKQYIKEHFNEDWKLMLEILKQLYPSYYKTSKEVFNHNILYGYNIFIAKKEIFNHYCEWIFPLLFKMEKTIGNKQGDAYQSRYIGFMAERLFTLYIFHNQLEKYEVETVLLFNGSKDRMIKNSINNILFKMTGKIKIGRR